MVDFRRLLGDEWYEALESLINSDYWKQLGNAIAKEREIRKIYPEKGSELLFKAFRTTPLSKVKVVILGQDPYHDGSYDGFAFSNSPEKRGRVSPSLQNILREVQDDIAYSKNFETYIAEDHTIVSLERWAVQGVLLINTAHTVAEGVPDSHTALWKPFTKRVIEILLSFDKRPLVFILWGKRASKIVRDVSTERFKHHPINIHYFIETAHPSPFSAYTGFFGSKPFSKTNEFLINNNIDPIIW